MKKTIVILSVLLFSVSAMAKEKAIVQEGKGIASTREDAIKKAIFEAVAKAKGIDVGSGRYRFNFESATADIARKPGGKEIGFDAISIYAEGTSTRTAISALVKTYKVLEEKQLDPNTWEVRLKVWIYDYQPPDENKRPRIAVVLPITSSSEYSFGNIAISNTEMQYRIANLLISKLVKTHKFAIVNRHYVENIMNEKKLVLNGDTSLEEKAKIGKLLGADYVLITTLNEASLSAKPKFLAAVGQQAYEHEARFNMDYSLIGAATSQVKFADSVDIWLEHDKDVRKLVSHWQDDKIDYGRLAGGLIMSAAAQITKNITQNLYPVRIAKILPNKTIVVNKGGADIAEADIYDCLKEGQEIFDYDTKESLGKIEEPVATIKITKVMSNFSYAVLVEGSASDLSEGVICRKHESEPQKPVEQPSDTKVTPSCGVKMPFDK